MKDYLPLLRKLRRMSTSPLSELKHTRKTARVALLSNNKCPYCHFRSLFIIIFSMSNKLFFIKSIHTFIFFFQVACLVYVLYAGITRTFNLFLLLAITAIFFNGLLLLINRGRCPLTTLVPKKRTPKKAPSQISSFQIGLHAMSLEFPLYYFQPS